MLKRHWHSTRNDRDRLNCGGTLLPVVVRLNALEWTMRSYFILFTLALLVTLGLTPLVRRWAIARGIVDHPDNQRRIHGHPIPRLGGVAIYLSFIGVLLVVPLLGNLVGQNFRANWQVVIALLTPATLIFAL